MRSRFKILVIAGSPLTAALGASATAAATTVPVMDTPTFACGNGVWEVGPGNVGGNLPPGLQLSLPSSEWTVTGTPTKAVPVTMSTCREIVKADHRSPRQEPP
jgi:hypothetical protein